MKKYFLIIAFFIGAFGNSDACTTFVINDSEHLLFCRNYDFDFGAGFIVINKRGVKKHSLVYPPFQPLKWTSEFGSVTFNQVGIDAPMGGMNERGLVVAQMALLESKYPEVKNGKVLNQLEWIQYQLDNSASLTEVIEKAKELRIVPIATPVHYFICDAEGNIGIIEFLKGEMKIYSGKQITVPACSNMIYEQSQKAIKEYEGFGGAKPVPIKWKSVADIIAIANSKIIEFQKSKVNNPIEYGFETLAAVSSLERTQWSVVYDIRNMKIYFKSLHNKKTRTINFHNFNFDCENTIQILDIQTSDNLTPIKSQFYTLTKAYYSFYKKDLIQWFKENVKGFPDIPNEAIEEEVKYVFERECR